MSKISLNRTFFERKADTKNATSTQYSGSCSWDFSSFTTSAAVCRSLCRRYKAQIFRRPLIGLLRVTLKLKKYVIKLDYQLQFRAIIVIQKSDSFVELMEKFCNLYDAIMVSQPNAKK